MGKGAYALLATLTCVALLPRCHSEGEEDTVHLDRPVGGL